MNQKSELKTYQGAINTTNPPEQVLPENPSSQTRLSRTNGDL